MCFVASYTKSSQNGSYPSNSKQAWDDEKERNRLYCKSLLLVDKMYDFMDWDRHRSSYRYVRNILTFFQSRIVWGLWKACLATIAFALGVAFYNQLHLTGHLSSSLPALPSIPMEPFQLTSFALSLLLVFRTNTSYSRWDEGRRKYGIITMCAKDLARQAFAWFRQEDMRYKQMMARWLIAFIRTCKVHLRKDGDLAAELQGVLNPVELQSLLRSPHAPNYCMQVITTIIGQSGIDSRFVSKMDSNMSMVVDAVAACERILNTPIPLSYTRHTGRFLILWLFLLPFALWAPCGWTMVPVVALISFVLLGIEEIGVQIEEPFSILALDGLGKRAELKIRALLSEHEDIICLVSERDALAHFPTN